MVFYFFVPVLIKELANFLPLIIDYFPKAGVGAGGINMESIGSAGDLANEIVSNASLDEVVNNIKVLFETISSSFVSTISAFFGGVANIILVAIISFYLSISKDGISSFLKIITPIQNEKYVIDLWERARRIIA